MPTRRSPGRLTPPFPTTPGAARFHRRPQAADKPKIFRGRDPFGKGSPPPGPLPPKLLFVFSAYYENTKTEFQGAAAPWPPEASKKQALSTSWAPGTSRTRLVLARPASTAIPRGPARRGCAVKTKRKARCCGAGKEAGWGTKGVYSQQSNALGPSVTLRGIPLKGQTALHRHIHQRHTR